MNQNNENSCLIRLSDLIRIFIRIFSTSVCLFFAYYYTGHLDGFSSTEIFSAFVQLQVKFTMPTIGMALILTGIMVRFQN
ncbi:Hypothetical predicted protein [Cloeon dipterum]|uniref:Uncharacterized protein n=1 Tax=Cloeon dipterum TaxID=197152 RepID=A0A8S1DPP7_9INSE|nr:Hypothetical predicted protein [Cloeon dipterum]